MVDVLFVVFVLVVGWLRLIGRLLYKLRPVKLLVLWFRVVVLRQRGPWWFSWVFDRFEPDMEYTLSEWRWAIQALWKADGPKDGTELRWRLRCYERKGLIVWEFEMIPKPFRFEAMERWYRRSFHERGNGFGHSHSIRRHDGSEAD